MRTFFLAIRKSRHGFFEIFPSQELFFGFFPKHLFWERKSVWQIKQAVVCLQSALHRPRLNRHEQGSQKNYFQTAKMSSANWVLNYFQKLNLGQSLAAKRRRVTLLELCLERIDFTAVNLIRFTFICLHTAAKRLRRSRATLSRKFSEFQFANVNSRASDGASLFTNPVEQGCSLNRHCAYRAHSVGIVRELLQHLLSSSPHLSRSLPDVASTWILFKFFASVSPSRWKWQISWIRSQCDSPLRLSYFCKRLYTFKQSRFKLWISRGCYCDHFSSL